MRELGPHHDAGHHEVGRAAARVVVELVVVGAPAAGIGAGAIEAGLAADRVHPVADREAARATLAALLRPGDVVLVKASRGAALEALVDDLAAGLLDGRAAGVVAPGQADPTLGDVR
jgi:UDP-N-acetylmuramoyl-tripeptide--D-alanyl-D-alanine ligase